MITLIVLVSALAFVLFVLLVGVSARVTLRVRRSKRERSPDASPAEAKALEGPPGSGPSVEEVDPDLIARVEEVFAGPGAGLAESGAPGAPAPQVVDAPETPAPPAVEPREGPAPGVPGPEARGEGARPRLRDRLGKARALLSGRISAIAGSTRIDAGTWEELEEALILADAGVTRTTAMLDRLRSRVKVGEIRTAEDLVAGLKADLKETMANGDHSLHLKPGPANVWLFVGVNGVGKTTTIGKVALRQMNEGRTVVMAAGDTFRAAAAEQLELWAERVGADLVRGAEGGDPGSVIFDAVQRAAARGTDLVLADTAGRLHTKVNLMEELRKVRRIAERPPGQLTEVLLVIDATTGQNGLIQARQFADAVGVTGIVLTKLDGTAKGGIVLAIQGELDLPIKLVGLGEKAADLVEFDPDEFVDALFE
ncbi:MAG: signal recognition particle-docking protein FtsY [Acidimicrobiales bacterium]